MQGAGYLDEQINQNSGVAQTSSANLGYGNGDGSYTPLRQEKFQALPIDTDDALVNELNTQSNEIMARSLKSPALRQLEDIVERGNGLDFNRDGMDHFMAFDFGHSKYDEGVTNALTAEAVKKNRADEQTVFAPVVNGLGRCGIRTVGTIGSIMAGILDFGGRVIFGKDKKTDITEGVAQLEDFAIDKWNETLPVYQTVDQERIAQEHPLDPRYLTSGANVATFIDNFGFTIGAMVGGNWVAKIGSKALIGLSAAMTGDAIYKAADNEEYSSSRILPAAMAAIGMVAGGAAGKLLKPYMRVQLGTICATEMSAIGEGAIEGVNAKKEFIDEKFAFYDNMTRQRKAELKQQYDKAAMEAGQKAYNEVKANDGTEEEARFAMLNAQKKAMEGYENDLAIIDWQGTKTKNQVLGEAEGVRNLTTLINIPILTASNYIQWGKMLSGGFKTYRSMVNVEARAEAKAAGQNAYKEAYRRAQTTAERQAVKARQKEIEGKAMIEWAKANGKLFDTPKASLTARDWSEILLKHPFAEGSEEINQAAAANFSKGYHEWITDNYYSQVSDLDTYRESESAFQAGVKGLVKTYFTESAWNEFLMGALTGLIGIPGWRGFKEKTVNSYDQEGNLLSEPNVQEKKHIWPFVMRGGVYGEYKKMKKDKENAARMADQLNKYLSEENLDKLKHILENVTRDAQYQKDKRVFVEEGDKYNYQTAVDKELVNALELFQNSGNMDVFRALVYSLYDVKTAEDMIALQEQTMTTDADGQQYGPYSEFHIMKLDENATDAQKEANEEQMRKMSEKIRENADHLVEAIDMYERARREMDVETQQGLTDSQLNCLTWYKVRLGLFDNRIKDMYGKSNLFLADFMSNIDGIYETAKTELEDRIAQAKEYLERDDVSEKDKEEVKDALEKNEFALRQWEIGVGELKRRWSEVRTNSGRDLKDAKYFFSGNTKADPVSFANGTWQRLKNWARGTNAEEIHQKQMAAQFFIRNMMNILQANNTATGAYMESKLQGGMDVLKEYAQYVIDMSKLVDKQAAFKEWYKFFKDNPGQMVMAEQVAKIKTAMKAHQEEVDKTVAELRKNADSLTHLYDAVIKMILDGKDIATITETVNQLAKEGNQAAIDFNTNQMFVKVFANALDEIVLDVFGDATPVYRAIVIQAVIDSSREVVGGEEILKRAQEKLNDIFKDKNSLVKYIKDNKLATDDTADNIFIDEVKTPVRDSNGKEIRNADKSLLRKPTGKNTADLLRDITPHVIAAAKGKVANKYKIYTAYSGGEHMTDEEIRAYNDSIVAATQSAEVDPMSDTIVAQQALSHIGPKAEEADDSQQGGTNSTQQGGTTTQTKRGTTTTTPSQGNTNSQTRKSDEQEAAEKEVERCKDSINFLEYELQKEEDIANNESLPEEDREASRNKAQQRREELAKARQDLAEAQKRLDDILNKDTNGDTATGGQQDGQQNGTSTEEELKKAQQELEELRKQQEELERKRKAEEEAAKSDKKPQKDDSTDGNADTDTNTDTDEDADTDEEEEQPIEEEEEANRIDERIKDIDEKLASTQSEEDRQTLEEEKATLQEQSAVLRDKAAKIKEERQKDKEANKEKRKREKKADKRDKKETPKGKEDERRKLQEEIQKKIDEKLAEMERLEEERLAEEAADAMAHPDSAVGDDNNIDSNKKVNEEREEAETIKKDEDKTGIIRPILSYFNLEFRHKGRYIPNNRVRFRRDGKGMEVCKEGEAGWCEAFWQTYEKLGIFKCIDEVEAGSPNAIKEGDEVFFLIDAVEPGHTTSKYLGLTADECHYKGHPIIWMVVKRKDGKLQAVGSLATNDRKTYEYGQIPLRVEIEERFKAGGNKAYMHDKSSTISEIQTGYVAASKENQNLVNIYGSSDKVRLVTNVQTKENAANGEGPIFVGDKAAENGSVSNPGLCSPGSLCCLIHDNATGKDVAYKCNIAKYGIDTYAQKSQAWQDADILLQKMLDSFTPDMTLEAAKLNMNNLYNELSDIVNLKGFGVTLSVRQDRKSGQFYIVVGRQDAHAKELLDENGNVKRTKKGTPLHERTEAYVYLNGTIDDFRKALVGEKGLPFRVYTGKLKEFSANPHDDSQVKTLIEDGVIMANIQSGMTHTVGAYVKVSTELNETSGERRKREKREDATFPQEDKDSVYSKTILDHKIEVDDRHNEIKVDGERVTNERTKRLLKNVVEGESWYDYVEDQTGMLPSCLFVKNQGEDKIEILYMDKDGVNDAADAQTEVPFYGNSRELEEFMYMQKEAAKWLAHIKGVAGEERFATVLYSSEKIIYDPKNIYTSPAHLLMVAMVDFADWIYYEKDRRAIDPNLVDFCIDLLNSKLYDEKYRTLRYDPSNSLLGYFYSKKGYIEKNEGNTVVVGETEYTKKDVDTFIDPNGKEWKIVEVLHNVNKDPHWNSIKPKEAAQTQQPQQPTQPTPAPQAQPQRQPTTEERQPDPTVDPVQGTEQGNESGNRNVTKSFEGATEDNNGTVDNDDFMYGSSVPFSIRKPSDEKAAKMNREKEMAAVRKIFPSMTHDESVEFVDDLIEVGSKGLVAQGLFKSGRMVVSKNAVRGTLFHEAFHKIYRTALSEENQRLLLEDVRRVMNDYELKDYQAEEILCDWFRDYMVDQVYGKSWTQRIKDFFRRLFNLVRPGYEGLTRVTLDIFAEAQEGSYDRPRFEYKTVKEERIEEYNRMGLTYSDMELFENARSSYAMRTEEEKSMLADAGIAPEIFNRFSPKSREEIIDCL